MALDFLKLLNPICPFITEELWSNMGHNQTMAYESWPVYDESKIITTEYVIGVQINGKLRANIKITDDDNENTIKEKALSESNVKKYTQDHEIVKLIIIPKRIVSIVIK
jgi:leucyl-tRNA synthetase